MRTFSEFTEVLWVESSGMRVPNPFSSSDWKRVGTKLFRSQEGVVPEEPGLKVVAPLSLPFPKSRVAQGMNRRIFRRSISRAQVDPGDALLWVYTPTVAPLLRGWRNRGLVYHCVDRWWEFSEYDPDLMRSCHQELCERADVTFASSAGLLVDCEAYTDRAFLVRHGVDWEHFEQAAAQPQEIPDDLAHVSGPIIGFFGLIHDWIDQDLILAVAEAYPEATVVLIGKTRVDTSRLQARANIILTGQKPYSDLPAYAATFSVGLVPFVINELTLAVNPIKLREYLSAGVPVVSTALPELAVFEEREDVEVAKDATGFVRAIGEVLAKKESEASRRERARLMQSESWLGRCKAMISHLDHFRTPGEETFESP
jgi:glycosyltransferase involved in cell wall biosynthesis